MRKYLPAVLSACLAVSFSQLAAAQPGSISVETPRSGDISVEQRGIQNSQQIGSDNQQSQQYGEGNTSSQAGAGGTAENEQNRQYNRRYRDDDDDKRRGNQGWHKGWENNKHRDEVSGKYDGRRDN